MRRLLVQSAFLDCSESTSSRKRVGVRRRRSTPRGGCPKLCDASVRDRARLLSTECRVVSYCGHGKAVGAGKAFCSAIEATTQSRCAWPEESNVDSCRGLKSRDTDRGHARFEYAR